MDPGPPPRRLARTTVSADLPTTDVGPDRGSGAVLDTIARVGVVPVVTLDRLDDAVPLATALVTGGLPVVEITLRTEVGLDAIAAVAAHVEGATVGAGSVITPGHADAAVDAGARFLVSPGLAVPVVQAAARAGVPSLPGIATPTELMAARSTGASVVKLFPAEVVGGLRMVDAVSAVFPDIRIMPTGGVNASNAAGYLAHPNVLAVGGSWMVPTGLVDAADWAGITELAAAAAEIVAAARSGPSSQEHR